MADILAIDESAPKYKIDKLTADSEAAKEIYNKSIAIYESYSRFWAPRLEVAKKCQRYMRRDIFDRGQRLKYQNVQKKIPVEPQEMKQVIDALQAQIIQTVKGSIVTMEDGNPPQTAAAPPVVNTVLKWLDTQHKLKRKRERLLREGLITGYPVWLWFDKTRLPGGYYGGVEATLLPYESTLCTPHFQETDGSDIEDNIVLSMRSYAKLYEKFPERKEAHRKHLELMNQDPEYIKRHFEMDETVTSDDRKSIIFDRVSSARFDSITGQTLVMERYFPVKKRRKVYVNEETHDIQILPEQWDDERKQSWLRAHPEYALTVTDEVKTLWLTTVSSDGFVWANDEHWFQEEGMLPGRCFIADMVDRIPTGKGEDMLPYILSIAVCETEGLANVRTGSGTTTVVTEGALRHPSRIETELSRENGVVVLKKGYSPREHFTTVQRTPNDTYHVMADRTREQLSGVHRVNDAAMGQSHPRQSDKAKQREVQQGLNPQSPFIQNYNDFCLNLTQLLCYMLPYCITEQQVIEIEDEFGTKQEPVEVNQQAYDLVTGQATVVANDLTSVKYRIVPIPGDDSMTSKEKQLGDFAALIEAVGNTLFQIDPRILANILKSWPNQYAHEAGKSLEKFAEQNAQEQQQVELAKGEQDVKKLQAKAAIELEKIKKPRFNVRLSPQDLNESPLGFQVMMQMLQAMNAPPAEEPPMEQQPEEMQAQPQMA